MRDQRREERTAVNWIALIRLTDGTEIPCSVKDVSKAGMKVCVPQEQVLPHLLTLKIVGRDLVFLVEQAWRHQHHLGVSIRTVAKLPPKQAAESGSPSMQTPIEKHTKLGSRRRNFQ